ncbi:unnamed protein product [Rhizophagus irregularis]|uniref:Uncharacterized protein n=1 Tax=Rhizophagus irregularis TaxID=588596 RepID=A0A916A173_9GLOM|nr:unnamed protein product [Rhizophagus irregularis]CAB4473889.1 unnamed protein product [Rhizophagus irregularis]CAB5211420.1 unnamed protein product [Rhizophagus irregularis]CAB5322843.1 unnamed protein product [Rhizophagus irregularis]CAB5394904.1 unnamed protein product [Rhizophagus irregularis]
MITSKIHKTLFLAFFLPVFLSYHLDAICQQITNKLRTDGNWNLDDTFYPYSSGNITFTLTEMPCGASTLLIQLVSQNGLGGFHTRTFTSNELNVAKYVGVNVTSVREHLFRIQAMVDDFTNINCINPSFSGEICYSKYVDPPDCEREKNLAIDNCKNEKVIEITVPIATAIIGVLGGIAGVLIKQRLEKKSNKSSTP